jgi:hypothetical protein
VGLAAECVIREWLEWGWVVLVRSAAGHDRLKLGDRPLEISCVRQVGGKRLEGTCVCGGMSTWQGE